MEWSSRDGHILTYETSSVFRMHESRAALCATWCCLKGSFFKSLVVLEAGSPDLSVPESVPSDTGGSHATFGHRLGSLICSTHKSARIFIGHYQPSFEASPSE